MSIININIEQNGFLYNKKTNAFLAELFIGNDLTYCDELTDNEVFYGTQEEAETFGIIFNNQNQL